MKNYRYLIVISLLCFIIPQANAGGEVNVYSYRQAFLIKPLLDLFTKESGIKVNVKYAKKGLVEKLRQEGKYSPADVILTVDISRLMALKQAQVVQPLKNKTIYKNIAKGFRDADNEWFALTARSRIVYSSRANQGKLGKDFTYLSLADPKYKGKVCTRSFKHPYNVSLLASIIAHEGNTAAKKWLVGLKNNLARRPQGNDRAQVRAIKEGLCNLAIGNSYYYGKMLQDKEQRVWAQAAYINFPDQKGYGAHMNVSGMALAKYAPNRTNAEKLMEFLTSVKAQQMYAKLNYEYPIREGVKPSKLLQSWGSFKKDSIALTEIAKRYAEAVRLVDQVGFDF